MSNYEKKFLLFALFLFAIISSITTLFYLKSERIYTKNPELIKLINGSFEDESIKKSVDFQNVVSVIQKKGSLETVQDMETLKNFYLQTFPVSIKSAYKKKINGFPNDRLEYAILYHTGILEYAEYSFKKGEFSCGSLPSLLVEGASRAYNLLIRSGEYIKEQYVPPIKKWSKDFPNTALATSKCNYK